MTAGESAAACSLTSVDSNGDKIRSEVNRYSFAQAARKCPERAQRMLNADARKGAVEVRGVLDCRGDKQYFTVGN